MGAVVASEVPRPDRTQAQLNELLARVNGLLTVTAGVIVVLSLLALTCGAWPYILSTPIEDTSAPVAATIALGLFAIALRFSVGYRVLLATDRAHVAVLLQGLTPAIALLVVAAGFAAGWESSLFAVATPVGMAMTALATQATSRRLTGLGVFGVSIRRQLPHVSISAYAVPMLVVSASTAAMLQSDRLLLSHWSTAIALAAYAVASQLYFPAFSLVSTSSAPLWARFARNRTSDIGRIRDWLLMTGLFALIGVLTSVGLWIATPWYQLAIGAESLEAIPDITIALCLLLVVQSMLVPTMSFLTTPQGLKVQMGAVIVGVATKFVLAFALIDVAESSAPVIASSAGLLLQGLICVAWILVRSRGRAQ